MDKNAIKKYAVWARRELIERVSQKALQYGITADGKADPNADSVNGRLLTDAEKKQRRALIRKVNEHGYEQVIEEVAYTWFNRFAALRFMEVNGYLPSHVRVFTNDAGEFKPQILAEAIHLDLAGLNMDRVYELKNANKDEELFKYLLVTQCNAMSPILPKMFQRIADDTELLLPDYLLREGSVIHQMIVLIPEEDWRDQVQIIGWLYQYYNTEPKDKVFADLKKNIKITKENIPAATQLFTPDWIVRYMVENSLGRLWLEGHPNDALKSEWKYYLDEAEQEAEVQAQLAEIRKEYAMLKPEEIRCIDPCMGSGHILCYLFDVLVQIYEDYGHTAREAVSSIVEKNLWGLDIDDRAAQLAYFAVMMKARQYDRRFFAHPVQPHIYNPKGYPDGEEFGSLLAVDELEPMPVEPEEATLFDESYETKLNRWNFRRTLAQKYHVVCTNPPYMGGVGMNSKLSEFVKKNYPNGKSDLFSCFMDKADSLVKPNGFTSLITMESWMFLSSFEKVREKVNQTKTIINMVHMPYLGKGGTSLGINFGTAAVIMRKGRTKNYLAQYEYTVYYECDEEGVPFVFPTKNERWKTAKQDNFSKIPGSPIAYWVSERFISIFANSVISDVAEAQEGLKTGDNERFIRQWYEVKIEDTNIYGDNTRKWIYHTKGGDFRKWSGNRAELLNYGDNGQELRAAKGSSLTGVQNYFLPCITYNRISSAKTSFRYAGANSIPNMAGLSLYLRDDEYLLYLLGWLNTDLICKILSIINPTLNFPPGTISKLPVKVDFSKKPQVDNLVEENIHLSQTDWDSFEISWDFKRHPLARGAVTIAEAFAAWEAECNDRFNQLKANEEELNRIFIDIYGLQDELDPVVEDKDVTVRKADLGRDIRSLISYAVGCMFGRYSLDVEGLAYAGGEWDAAKYKTFQPDKDAILPICDDDYFEDDIMGRFVEWVETVYGKATLEENLKFIADALGGKGSPREVIRKYFLGDFYADHCKIYQKRPIYWLFDSGKKNGFKCLIYLHRYQPDTIARIRTDYVHEQQSRYRTAIANLEQRINGASTSERVKLSKRLAALQAQVAETRVYEEKIHHLADQMIKIDLDDGVKKNYAIFQDVLAKIK